MAKNREITQFASLVSVHDSNKNITIVSAGDAAKVGIGTDPGYKLDVGGDLNVQGTFYQNGAEFRPSVFVEGEVGLGVTSSIGIGTDNTQGFQLYVLGSTNLDGPVNVTGVSTFGEQLDINDDVDISGNLRVAGITTLASLGGITTTGGDLFVGGNAKIIGILTVGSSSLTLDGDNDVVNVGTALTLGHTQGIQFHTQSLHSEGFEVNNINATGIVTAATLEVGTEAGIGVTIYGNTGIVSAVRYFGDGSQLTGVSASGGGGQIFIQEEGTQVGGAVTTINIVGPRITATSSVGVATISVDVDEFPTGDYGDLSSATTDAFGIALSYAFDCLTQPQYLITTFDLQVLT